MTEHRQVPSKTFGGYIILHTIGKGEFGKVKLAYDPNKDLEVAIKFIKRSNITSSQKQAKLEREINILQNLNHPHIVRLYDVIETEKYIGIVMAYANGGELFEYISENQYLSEEESAKFFIQLLDGVQYLHNRHIVHRDLKLENLLLDQKGDIVITDFGFANNSRKNPSGLLSTSCGSPCYAAPELVINDNYVGEAADIWSCGIILYAMLCGYLPFDDDPNNPDGENLDLLYKYILESQLTFPEYVSEDAQDLVCGMLIPDPEKRWPMEKVINHKWLRNSAYAKEKMNETMNSMNLDYMYDDSYLKFINESTNSEIEKIQDTKVPDLPPPAPHGTHSRQIGLDDETEHTEVFENRVNVSVNENVDVSIDKTEYIPNQESQEVKDSSDNQEQIAKVESQDSSSQEYMDAQQELQVELENTQEELMEVEEVVEDKMEVDEPTTTSEVENSKAIEAERQNAEKQIEKLINEIQQEQFTHLEEMKDKLQEVKDNNNETEEPETKTAETPAVESVEVKEEVAINSSSVEAPTESVKEEQPIETEPEVKEEAIVEEIVVEEVKEEIPEVSKIVEEKEEVKEQVTEPATEKMEETTVSLENTEEIKEKVEEVDSTSAIKLEKEDFIEVDEENHSSTTSESISSTNLSEDSKRSEDKVAEENDHKEEKSDKDTIEVDKKEEKQEEVKDINLTEADADINRQDSSKESEITTAMEEDETDILKKRPKNKKNRKRIGKKEKEIKKKNKKNIKFKIKENKMFRKFFGCVMKN
ncbi:hypothetical protein BCR36DRAFT_585982 [Piromyces finnis]|uniref:Protein kinase domain-containing protein n=1 Tax=Piromyces finnis TaxID=1754191 RepID=A0A1Y1V1C5_9FUNG|nr:hypothetical protein BCR36DRAFT_585982 [Piromyces finnis]|eukprot:ORX44876.1 hypothetical protein BCR36DRAFT_585982 [Piromyces finnis]